MGSNTTILVLSIVGMLVICLIFTCLLFFPKKSSVMPSNFEQVAPQTSTQSPPLVVKTTCREQTQKERKKIFLPDAVAKIEKGGPSKDGIPSIVHPQFVGPSEADFLVDTDVIIGLSCNGVVK